jgi:MoaA/NifB/PqqE/SkfB family radical SAM enzyme
MSLKGSEFAVPISQMWTVATYVLKQKIAGRKQYPLVLMLEPLFRCNLACAGCGKIQYPTHILKKQLTPEECSGLWKSVGRPW